MKILLEEKEDIAIVKMNNGVTNAIDQSLINDFENTLELVEKNNRGLIIFGNEKFFSMGFNLPLLLKLNRNDFEKFYTSFNELVIKLFTLSIPTLSVIEGHAVAGGFILAIATDYRIAVIDKKLGLNEINLGVPVPILAIELLERLTDKKKCENLLYSGELIKTQDALKYNIIDEIVSTEEIAIKAFEKIKLLSTKPKKAFSNIKRFLHEEIVNKFKEFRDLDKEKFLDCWFSEEAQAILIETAKKF
jgi:enoyl-CoA hydratase/carnithine racemase